MGVLSNQILPIPLGQCPLPFSAICPDTVPLIGLFIASPFRAVPASYMAPLAVEHSNNNDFFRDQIN